MHNSAVAAHAKVLQHARDEAAEAAALMEQRATLRQLTRQAELLTQQATAVALANLRTSGPLQLRAWRAEELEELTAQRARAGGDAEHAAFALHAALENASQVATTAAVAHVSATQWQELRRELAEDQMEHEAGGDEMQEACDALERQQCADAEQNCKDALVYSEGALGDSSPLTFLLVVHDTNRELAVEGLRAHEQYLLEFDLAAARCGVPRMFGNLSRRG